MSTDNWSLKEWRTFEQNYFAEHPGIQTRLVLKRLLDLILAGMILALLLPVLLLISLAVRFSSPGPIFFIQERLGRLGQPFYIYKFRTMIDGAVHMGAGLHTFEGDPRVTTVGKFLREYHLDELPQLLNVLRGEMSLVGPRPLLMLMLPTYSAWEKRRLLLPPGITGWEAIKGGLINSLDQRTDLDVWYVNHWSLRLDLWILVKTIPVVLRKEGVYGE